MAFGNPAEAVGNFFYMCNELSVETVQHIVPPSHSARKIYKVHKRRIRLGFCISSSLNRLFKSHDRLLNDPAPSPIEEIHNDSCRCANAEVLPYEQADVRPADVDLS